MKRILGEETTQQDCFNECGIMNIINSVVLDGFSGCIFAY
jgi:hypothetical protein